MARNNYWSYDRDKAGELTPDSILEKEYDDLIQGRIDFAVNELESIMGEVLKTNSDRKFYRTHYDYDFSGLKCLAEEFKDIIGEDNWNSSSYGC